MKHQATSIRTFIGAKDFTQAKRFYKDLGFEEIEISEHMSYFRVCDALGFYLQNAYVKDWIENSMIFLEVEDVYRYRDNIQSLQLEQKYNGVKLSAVREETWGRECFLHDPSGVLWHFGEFKK